MVLTVYTDFSLASKLISEEVPPSLKTVSPDFAYLNESTIITITGNNLSEATSTKFTSLDSASELLIDQVNIVSNTEIRCTFYPEGTYGEQNFEVLQNIWRSHTRETLL